MGFIAIQYANIGVVHDWIVQKNARSKRDEWIFDNKISIINKRVREASMHPSNAHSRRNCNDQYRSLLAALHTSLHVLNAYGIEIKHYFMQMVAYNDNYCDTIYVVAWLGFRVDYWNRLVCFVCKQITFLFSVVFFIVIFAFIGFKCKLLCYFPVYLGTIIV